MHTDVAHPVHFALVTITAGSVDVRGGWKGSCSFNRLDRSLLSAGGPVVFDTEADCRRPLAAYGHPQMTARRRPFRVSQRSLALTICDASPEMWCYDCPC